MKATKKQEEKTMEDMTGMTLGKRILYHRKRLGLTQDQLAEKMGVTAQAVSKWEHDLSCPDVTTLPRLADLFGITTDELLGVPRQEEKVHVGEVVGLREEKKGSSKSWSLEFRPDKSGAVFALFLIALGGLYIAVTLLNLDVSFWSLLWPTALMGLGVSCCLDRVSVFGVGTTAAGLYFLLVKLDVLPSLLTWPLVLGALLVLWGASVILERPRRKKKGWHGNVQSDDHGREGKPRREFYVDDGYVKSEIAFCSDTIRVQTQELRGGKVELGFGSLILDFTGCESVAPGCALYLDSAFSSLVVQTPRRYRVELELDRTGTSVDISGRSDAEPQGVIRLQGDCAFGSLKIQYI